MKKRTLSFFLCLAMVISLFVQAFPAAVAAEADETVTILRNGEAVSEISLAREEKTTLTASFAGAEDCQWQILLSPESDQWVDIYDKTAPDCEVSYALVKNMLDDSGSAYLRCAVTGETTVYSDPVCVTVLPAEQTGEEMAAAETSAPLAPAPLPAPVTEEGESAESVADFLAVAEVAATALLADGESSTVNENVTLYTVTIEYKYSSESKFKDQLVAQAYIAQVAAGDTLTEKVASPNCVGYVPDPDEIDLSDLGVITEDKTLTVYYSPAEVSYTVRHYQQNVDDDEYTWVDTTMVNGYTEAQTSDNAAKTYSGFTALSHYHEEIAADSSTMIDIYYDRNYYLLSFDLGGGYGVEPIYARYGTPISVGIPTKTGWDFNGWTDKDGNEVTIPKTMPDTNTTYYADWSPSADGTKYSVVYWINNDDGTKTYLTTKDVTAQAGDAVYGVDDICGTEAHTHSDECNGSEHTHTIDCFNDAITFSSPFSSGNDYNVILNANGGAADTEGTYLYFIQAYNDKTNGVYWPKMYVNGQYYTIYVDGAGTINSNKLQEIAGAYVTEGTLVASGTTYYAYKYKINPSYTVCASCGKVEHSHSDDCKPDVAQFLDFVEADEDVTVAGDGSTVVNVYYEYKEYTIRYVYARKTAAGSYQIATNTHEGGFSDCEWTDVTSLPTFTDPSGATERSSFTRTEDNCTYYYVSLKAEFGAYIGDKWPADNIGDVGSYSFGSWAAAPGTPYRELSTLNANIVGSYPTMSAEMIVDDPELLSDGSYLAQNMIAWWGSSSTIGDHAYHNYFEVLSAPNGEVSTTPTEIDGETYVKYGDKIYKLENFVFNVAHNGTTRVDPLEYIGYTVINNDSNKQTNSNNYANNGNCTICGTTCNYCNNFYYDRNVHTLKFWNHNTWLTDGDGVSVPYGAPLAIYESGTDASLGATALAKNSYPTGLETDVYEFAGWYTTAECHENSAVDWETATMPDSDLTLYAKWDLITHEVKVYKTDSLTDQIGDAQTVTHGEYATAPDETPTNGEEEFLGWFYMNNGEEKAFAFASTPITQDTNVYAKWRSNVMKQVTIRYVLIDNDGNEIGEVADPEVMMLRVGAVRTFDAKTGNSLYAEYRTGCFPTTATTSVTPKAEDEEITVTFNYKKYTSVAYNVEFYVQLDENNDGVPDVDANGTPVLRAAFWTDKDGNVVFVEHDKSVPADYEPYIEKHPDNKNAIVTELYTPEVEIKDNQSWSLPDEYLPNALRIQRIIVPGEGNTYNPENTIQFIYTYTESEEDEDGNKVYQARYIVQHFIESSTVDDVYSLYSYSDQIGLSGDTATASPISIPGYGFSYDVTNNKKQSGTKLTEGTEDTADVMSGTITADDSLELNFYYTVNSYPYRVMYLEAGTDRVLLDPTTTDTDGKKLMAKYGAQATAGYVPIEGYDVDAESKSINIRMEAGDTASLNTITFYYTRKSADLIVSKTVQLDEVQADEEGIDKLPDSAYTQEFKFTIDYPKGFYKSVYDCIITDAGGTETKGSVIAQTTSMSFTLKHGEKIQIKDLDMGTYTITETYVPGFRITVGDNTDAQQKENVSVTAELVEANKDVQVDFTNSYPFFTGELVLGKTVTKADSTDPDAKEPYKVTVTLTPADETREVDRTITWTDADNTAQTFTVPALTGTNDQKEFEFEVLVPVDGTVTLSGVPAGGFTAEETVKSDVGYITDYYQVRYNKDLHKNETTESASGAVVSSVIHGGHPTTVTFTNTYKKGDLTINKTVTQEYVNDNWQRDTFTFTITGTTELPDGTYVVDGATVTVSNGVVTVKDAAGNDPAISITKTDGTTSWTESLTFENLPAGYYTVTETAGLGNDKYTAVGPKESLLVNNTTTPTEANFTNTYKRTTGSLQVSKKIELVGSGVEIDKDQLFTFTVSLKDGTLTGPYTCEVKTTNETEDKTDDDTVVTDSLTSLPVESNGTLTFTLKHNQYILINGLPVGEYVITETQVEYYGSHFNDATNATLSTSATITTGETTPVTCVNKYPVDMGKLTVKKTVVTPAGFSDVNQAPDNDKFTFTVTIEPNSNLADLNTVTANFSMGESSQMLNVTDNNTITFELKHGQSVELELPACTYTIEETGLSSSVNTTGGLAEHYITTVGDTTGTTARGTLVAGGDDTVAFTNTYRLHYADLTIKNNGSPDEKQVFVYNVKNTKTNEVITVTVVGDGETTIHNLPVGKYTVTQQDDWSWRYDGLSDETTVTLEDPKGETLTVSQSVKNANWLDGVSELVKNVKGG